MKKLLWIVASLIILAGAALAYLRFAPRTVPLGQPPLVYLTSENLDAMRERFNAAGDRTRLLALLSPT